jgi:hypothetical protein
LNQIFSSYEHPWLAIIRGSLAIYATTGLVLYFIVLVFNAVADSSEGVSASSSVSASVYPPMTPIQFYHVTIVAVGFYSIF